MGALDVLSECLLPITWFLKWLFAFEGVSDHPGDPDNVARQLKCSAVGQKYAEQCLTWVALAAETSSQRRVDLCKFLKGPWEADARIENWRIDFSPPASESARVELSLYQLRKI